MTSPDDKFLSSSEVRFFLNGRAVRIDNPAHDLMLIDYLRSAEANLKGAKKSCGEGGCGACTVILSIWEAESCAPRHRAAHACLLPVRALEGIAVTTIEGTGAPVRPHTEHHLHTPVFAGRVAPPNFETPDQRCALANTPDPASLATVTAEQANPVALRIAVNNGTQCGFCTPGIVMNISALLAQKPAPTKREIEERLDANLCRCTGYRALLTGLYTLASDWTSEDEASRMKCESEAGWDASPGTPRMTIPFPAEAQAPPRRIACRGERVWLTASTLDDIRQIWTDHPQLPIRFFAGGTARGLDPASARDAALTVDIRRVPEISACARAHDAVLLGACTTYAEAIRLLVGASQGLQTSAWAAVAQLCRWTGGSILRENATLGGNFAHALLSAHLHPPFISDLLTGLAATDTEVRLLRRTARDPEWIPVAELLHHVERDYRKAENLLILQFRIPAGPAGSRFLSRKIGIREVNAAAWANGASRIATDEEGRIESVRLIYGGVRALPWRAFETERYLGGRLLSVDTILKAREQIEQEARLALNREPKSDYIGIESLIGAFLMKDLMAAWCASASASVPEDWRTADEDLKMDRPPVIGHQFYRTETFRSPVARPLVKLNALPQASGRVRYTQDLDVPVGTLHAAFVLSQAAAARFQWIDPNRSDEPCGVRTIESLLKIEFSSFVRLISAEDIPPGGLNFMGMGGDQPVFAVDRVQYDGQAIALVIAECARAAEDIAARVEERYLRFEPDRQGGQPVCPIFTLDEAIRCGAIFPDNPASMGWLAHVWRIERPQSRFEWIDPSRDPLDRKPRRREGMVDGARCAIVDSTTATGAQIHFYMETQACLVIPGPDDRMIVHASAQDPSAIHAAVASVLGIKQHAVEVNIPPVGGGFGGKIEPARFVAAATAVAAFALKRPVRVAVSREADSRMVGMRHPCHGSIQLAVDLGAEDPLNRGRLRGLYGRFWTDGGAFYDCSFVVSDCMQLRADNAYQIDHYRAEIDVCRTHTAPNTAFRAFGFIQANAIMESAIDDAAWAVGMPPHELREKNLYDRGDVTPAGQALSGCYLREVWKYLREEVADFDARWEETERFNRTHRWRKRGLCMLPLKYGAGYNLAFLQQASVLVGVYSGDGTVVIHQGGVEMGQGLWTMVEQVASYVLNIPMDMIRIEAPKTAVLPDPICTGASTGTTYNGLAARQACEQLRARLIEFGYRLRDEYGDAWCRQNGIDFWNYPDTGWKTPVAYPFGPPRLIWQNLVQLAHFHRVNLVVQWKTVVEGGTTPVPVLGFKPAQLQPSLPDVPRADPAADPIGSLDEFLDFTYSAACSEVEIDVLTGEHRILRVDLVYDVGWSLNPALDIGQVEGAFVQGIGYLMHERVDRRLTGPRSGRLESANTARYKPPMAANIPRRFNVHLFPRDRAPHAPENRAHLFSSKEVGEPPLVLASSVFLAAKRAIRAARLDGGLDPCFNLDAPATPDEILRALRASDEARAHKEGS